MSTPSKPKSWLVQAASSAQCSPPGSPRSSFTRFPSNLRSSSVASIASVSSTSSDFFAARLAFDVDDNGRPSSIKSSARKQIHRPADYAALYDHTGEDGYTEYDGPVNVVLVAEPCTTTSKTDPVWMLTWNLTAPTKARVVRRFGGTPVVGSQSICRRDGTKGRAHVYMMNTQEKIAGTTDLMLMHMNQHTLGPLTLPQRRALIEIAHNTAAGKSCTSRRESEPRLGLFTHRAWVKAVLSKACEDGIFDAARCEEATECLQNIYCAA